MCAKVHEDSRTCDADLCVCAWCSVFYHRHFITILDLAPLWSRGAGSEGVRIGCWVGWGDSGGSETSPCLGLI